MEIVEDLEYCENEHLGAGPEDRYVIFDVYCVTSTGEHIIVEMQNVRQSAFRDQMLFYAAAPIRKQASKGAWNFELKRVCSIRILNFTLDKADLSVPAGTRMVEQHGISDGGDATCRYIFYPPSRVMPGNMVLLRKKSPVHLKKNKNLLKYMNKKVLFGVVRCFFEVVKQKVHKIFINI